jgi:hypothetical protein
VANERGTGPSRLGKWHPPARIEPNIRKPANLWRAPLMRPPPARHRKAVAGIVAMGLGRVDRTTNRRQGRKTRRQIDARGGRPSSTKSGGMLLKVCFFRKLLL